MSSIYASSLTGVAIFGGAESAIALSPMFPGVRGHVPDILVGNAGERCPRQKLGRYDGAPSCGTRVRRGVQLARRDFRGYWARALSIAPHRADLRSNPPALAMVTFSVAMSSNEGSADTAFAASEYC